MTYPEVLANARTCIGQYCKACPVCNGVACKNQIPGPGAKGVGDTAIRTPDTTLELFGKSFRYPFFAGPVGAVNLHYSDTYTDMTYNDVLVRACAENGIGKIKRPLLKKYLTAKEQALQQTIKDFFDPHHKLGAGNIL